MTNYNYFAWFALIFFMLMMQTCTNNLYQQDIVRELRDIKYELKVKK